MVASEPPRLNWLANGLGRREMGELIKTARFGAMGHRCKCARRSNSRCFQARPANDGETTNRDSPPNDFFRTVPPTRQTEIDQLYRNTCTS
ncbi:hypothetical protein LSTR_LSTR014823 [Laodelphax striatellus]|uniref:Uncharacterized protein n=1 Tax=Laodelphax striatellus TaxID=195883 RepID=A0A482X711_LAOST|nr:hypothetical protein LSTR_LSTR014823 [Laodelphax striatellus]